MPALPILCSGFLWAGYRADSARCEVSLNCTFVCLFFCYFLFSWFLCILDVVAVGWLGLCGCALAGRLCMVFQRGLSASWVLYRIGNCFHQIVMIASKKIRHPYHLPRELRQNREYLNAFVLVSK